MTPMQPPPTDPAPARPAGTPRDEPGERPPGERRGLERPPSERYARAGSDAAPDAAGGGGLPRTSRAVLVALGGSVLVAGLGGPLSVTLGLLGVAIVVGAVVGSLARPNAALAVGLAVGSVAIGLIGVWLFARFEGGALGIVDYLAEVQGLLVPLELAAAGVAAWVTSR
jgi:hypothetical protein